MAFIRTRIEVGDWVEAVKRIETGNGYFEKGTKFKVTSMQPSYDECYYVIRDAQCNTEIVTESKIRRLIEIDKSSCINCKYRCNCCKLRTEEKSCFEDTKQCKNFKLARNIQFCPITGDLLK